MSRGNRGDRGDLGPPSTSGGSAEHPDELLASYALGLLEGDEHEQVEEHIRGCPTCAEEVHELREALDALPLAVPPVMPPPAARQALMDRVSASVRGERRAAPDEAAVATRHDPAGRGKGVWPGTAGWAAALAGAAVAGLSIWQAAVVRNELAAARQERAATEAALRRQVEALSQLDPQATRVAALRGGPQAAAIEGRVVYQPNRPTALAVLDHLPPLQPGQVYQLWLIQGSTPVSAGTFRADASGTGTLVVQAPSSVGSYSGLGLTAEPEPGMAAPTGAILATGAL